MKHILYHDNCLDGKGALYAALRSDEITQAMSSGEEVKEWPVQYGNPFPFSPGKQDTIYILDFSYDRPTLERVNAACAKLQVIDHHKTAQEALAGLPYCIFDMEKSGAVLAWEYFHPGKPVPGLLLHIQDRDLWKWELSGTKEILAGLRYKEGFEEEDFDLWDRVEHDTWTRDSLLEVGVILCNKEARSVQSAITPNKIASVDLRIQSRDGTTLSWKAALLNTTTLVSDIGNQLCQKGYDIAILYFIDNTGLPVFSFRSIGATDASLIAKSWGGGGHRNACGCKSPLNWDRLQGLHSAANVKREYTIDV